MSLENESSRDRICEIIKSLQEALANAAAFQSGKAGFFSTDEERRLAAVYGKKELVRMCQYCAVLIGYCEANVGAGHIVGALVSKLSEDMDK